MDKGRLMGFLRVLLLIGFVAKFWPLLVAVLAVVAPGFLAWGVRKNLRGPEVKRERINPQLLCRHNEPLFVLRLMCARA